MPELRSHARRDRANKKPNKKSIALTQSPVRRNPRRLKRVVAQDRSEKEAIVAADKCVSETKPLVNTAGREEEKIRVEKMDEFDSGGQAPVPDDEGSAPPLPEKV